MPRQIALTLTLIALSGLGLSAQQTTSSPVSAVTPASGALVITSEARPRQPHGACGGIRFLVDSEDTGGKFSIAESRECQKPVTGLHRHHEMDEAFYVVEGQLTVYVDGKTHTLGPGSYFFVPRGTPHAQGNPCKTPNKILVTFTPGGFERLLKHRGEVLQRATFGSPEFRAAMKPWEGVFGEALGPDPVGEVPCPAS